METAVLEARTAPTRTAALALGIGGLLQVAGGVLETVDRVVPPDPQYPLRTSFMSLTYVAFAMGVVLLVRRQPSAGARRARTAGLGVAAGGWLVMAVAQVALPWNMAFAERVLFPAGLLLVSAGMVMAGAVMFRGQEPTAGLRWLPLLCGAFPVVVIFPVFALLGHPSFLVLASYGACWVALAWAYGRRRP